MSHDESLTGSTDNAAVGRENYVHAVPLPVLSTVLAALLVMTLLTVAAARFDLGSWNLIIALGIATIKAALVVLFFMHLRYDNPFYAVVFITALLFVALFLGLTLLDTTQYQGDIQAWQQAQHNN
ncbi:MAG: cytochrome C oxidase subunit IV family protein [Thermoguttaceae bacterium]|jgi:cytochrome c oxidase subunit 4